MIVALKGDAILSAWLRAPISQGHLTQVAMGFYVGLATWELVCFTFALGVGSLREASVAILQRTAVLALSVPLLYETFGSAGIWTGLGLSMLLWTAWKLPLWVAGGRQGLPSDSRVTREEGVGGGGG